MPEKKKFRHRPEPLFIPPPPSYNANPATSYSGATLYQSQLRSPRVLGDHLLLDPARELPPYTPPPMLSPVRQGSGLFSNVLIAGHGPGAHPQLPLTPLTPTPRVLLCRSSESPPPPHTPTAAPARRRRLYGARAGRGAGDTETACSMRTLGATAVRLGRPRSQNYGLFGISEQLTCARAS